MHCQRRRARRLEVRFRRLGRHGTDPLEIRSGLEVLSRAAQYDDAQRGVPAELVHRTVQALDQGFVVGVVDVGAVQGHGNDAA
jgi:hypothetical protein